MGGNFTAVARGYAALAWNPATLGLPDGPDFSLSLAPVTAITGLAPIGLGDLGAFGGDTVPRLTRERWLAEIEGRNGQRGGAGADVTYLALSVGRFALQLSTSGRAATDLSVGAAELLLFGNAGRAGVPCACGVDGSSLTGTLVSTAAVGFGIPIGGGVATRTSLGATLHYSVGHALLHGIDLGSVTTADAAVHLRFPVVTSHAAAHLTSRLGSGIGLDVGFAHQRERMTLGVSVKNVLQTFAWDESKLRYAPASAIFDADTQEADFDLGPFEKAPEVLRSFVTSQRFRPRIVGGVALTPNDRLTLSADLRVRLGGDSRLDPAPALHAGAGAALRLPVVSLQAGGAALNDGYQIGGGIELALGPIRLGSSLLHRDTGSSTGLVAMLALVSGGR
jgi:hypothetical protein